MDFRDAVETAGRVLDVAGVAVIVVGAALATARFGRRWWKGQGFAGPYRTYRYGLGRAILLGLEFLVAADIIRTVAISPTFQSAGVLAVIVLIRTFLSFSLEVELEGRWPWERPRPPAEAGGDGA